MNLPAEGRILRVLETIQREENIPVGGVHLCDCGCVVLSFLRQLLRAAVVEISRRLTAEQGSPKGAGGLTLLVGECKLQLGSRETTTTT